MASLIKVDSLQKADGSPVFLSGQSAAKAYISLDVAATIYRSMNISSVVDVATGRTGISFVNAMGGEWAGTMSDRGGPRNGCAVSRTPTGCELRCYNSSANWANGDPDIAIYGEVAQ